MDAYNVVLADLKKYLKKGLKENIFVNPHIPDSMLKNSNQITSKYTRFNDELDFLQLYESKYESGEYLVALDDGSYFQINYEFNGKRNKSRLEKMNLCYLPAVKDECILNEYIRLDFSKHKEECSFYHSSAHLHVGLKNSLRLPAKDIMLFSEFCNMIFYLYYPTYFEKMGNNSTSYSDDCNGFVRYTSKAVLSLENRAYIYLNNAE